MGGKHTFPSNVSTAFPVFYRTYSRWVDGDRESWQEVCDRSIAGLAKLGDLEPKEISLISRMQHQLKTLPSGRWLWVGGTDWIKDPKNYSGAYNCTSTNITDWDSFGLMMGLAMMGCGTGAVLEPKYINQLPEICNHLNIIVSEEIELVPKSERSENTKLIIDKNSIKIIVGDSRQGWVDSYQSLMELASSEDFESEELNVYINLSNVRPAGERLKGFGGVSNPIKLTDLYEKCANILNKAIGRKLTAIECCLLIDEAASCVVAGNIRRSAGIRQFDCNDQEAANIKLNLWVEENEKWKVDPERDALRMANHTRVFHEKPTLEDCINSVRPQYYSSEGAIQWAGEAKRRAGGEDRYGLNPCGEIIGSDFHCNLAEVHLNQIDPDNLQEQDDAFTAGAIAVAALLNHQFTVERYQKSRLEDPIVGVSFTGLFDFFVKAFGVDWLKWWEGGRPETKEGLEFKQREKEYLTRWRDIVHNTVWDYCNRHNLKQPNRCTTVQPAGTKSLLTGASPGWHPPKSQRFIRRITFAKNDPVALACIDYGYSVVPSQSDKDEDGNLLTNPFDPRCTEWLVELPVEVSWANMPGVDAIAIEKFSALAQMDFYLQVQQHYTTHNTSATIEFRESEIEALGTRIYEAIRDDEGYISTALMARFDDYQSHPLLPFEPISKDQYDDLINDVLDCRTENNFHVALKAHDSGDQSEAGPAGCDSDKCLLPAK